MGNGHGGARLGAGRKPVSIAVHKLRGNYAPSRHAHLPDADDERLPSHAPDREVSPAERRAIVHGLGPAGRKLVRELLQRYVAWSPTDRALLHELGRSADRLAVLTSPTRLHSELRAFRALVKALGMGEK